MEWIPDPSAGSWLREHVDQDLNRTMHGVVPRGYPAYARIFHPTVVRSLPGGRVPTWAEYERMPASEHQRLADLFVDERTTWAETAAAFGSTLHPLAQWQHVVRTPPGEDWNTRIAPDGREFSAPIDGELDIEVLTALATHLIVHTTTPDAGIAALWEGHGGLLGHLGHSPSRVFFDVSDDPGHQAMLQGSMSDPFNNVFRRPTWQEGILSREISEAPRLELPGRGYVLFSASARDFTLPDWVLRAPWRDVPAEQHGFEPRALSPGMLWPDDRSWVMVSEVDFDSTVVAGPAGLIAEICADERIEALPIPAGADLTWDGDEVNG